MAAMQEGFVPWFRTMGLHSKYPSGAQKSPGLALASPARSWAIKLWLLLLGRGHLWSSTGWSMSTGCGARGFKPTKLCVRSYACIIPCAEGCTPMVCGARVVCLWFQGLCIHGVCCQGLCICGGWCQGCMNINVHSRGSTSVVVGAGVCVQTVFTPSPWSRDPLCTLCLKRDRGDILSGCPWQPVAATGLPKLPLWLLKSIQLKEFINYKAALSLRVLCSQAMAQCIPGMGS